MKTTIARKVLMALSGFFLLVFLLQHFAINFLSVISPNAFNSVSHFMGYNLLIQFVMQPILVFAVIFHLGMGIRLEIQNKKARQVKYAMNKPGTNSNWMSRNMIYTGLMVFAFLGLHFYDFWVPEIKYKYVDANVQMSTRYYGELIHKFADPVRVSLYCVSFVFLALHLLHGFQSAFQSVGFRHNKYTPIIKKLGDAYGILIPAGFIFIALYHFVSHS